MKVNEAVRKVQRAADAQAEQAATHIRINAGTNLLLAAVKPNYRWFRRMAGLRNGDAQRAA